MASGRASAIGRPSHRFPAEVAEMALAHTVSGKVEAAYRRGDLFEKRRQLAEAWAAYVDTPAMSRKVVPIHGDVEIEQLAQRRDRV